MGVGSRATQFKITTECSRCGVRLTQENKRFGNCVDCARKVAVERTLRWKARHPETAKRSERQIDAKRRGDLLRTERSLESLRAWIAANPDKVRAANAFKEARRRARCRKGEGITKTQWKEILESFGNACAYCLRSDVPMTMDHVIPLNHGGPHEPQNVVPACRSCNTEKQGRGPLVMIGGWPVRSSSGWFR